MAEYRCMEVRFPVHRNLSGQPPGCRASALLRAVLLCLVALHVTPARALDVEHHFYQLGDEFEFLVDASGRLELEELRASPESFQWRSSSETKPAAGYDPVWLRLRLKFPEHSLGKTHYLFSMAENLFDIRIYRPDASGQYHMRRTGNDYPASLREVDTPRYGFRITPTTAQTDIYLRVIGGPGTHTLPWVLVTEETLQSGHNGFRAFNLICLTALGTLLLFNASIAVSLRRREYAYYSVFVASVMLALVSVEGSGFYYLWPEAPYLNDRMLHGFNLVSAGARLLAITSFLGIASLSPGFNRVCKGVLWLLAAALGIVSLFGVKQLPTYFATWVWGIGILMGFAACIRGIMLKVRLAIPLLVALLLPTVGAVAQAALMMQEASNMMLVVQLAKISFVLHVLLFSICLATHMRIETEQRIQALHDDLTGLPGPTLLRERFEQFSNLSQRLKMQMAVLFIDLDGFKAVNDRLGHAAGDKLLKDAAQRMQDQLRGSDSVARLGGDEFVVLLMDAASQSSLTLVADRLLKAIAAPYWLDGDMAEISASVGIAVFPHHGRDLESLLRVADSAMYAAKERGKNRYVVAEHCDVATLPKDQSLRLVVG